MSEFQTPGKDSLEKRAEAEKCGHKAPLFKLELKKGKEREETRLGFKYCKFILKLYSLFSKDIKGQHQLTTCPNDEQVKGWRAGSRFLEQLAGQGQRGGSAGEGPRWHS